MIYKRITSHQRSVLKRWFKINNGERSSLFSRKILAAEIGLTPEQIQRWIHNKRQKSKLTYNEGQSVTSKRVLNSRSNKKLLKKHFLVNNFPDSKTIKEIIVQTSLSKKQVNKWFSNKRCLNKNNFLI